MNAEISSALATATAECLTAFGETVTINGVSKTARVQTLTHDEIVVRGGVGERGGFKLWITKAGLVAIPDKFEAVVARGITLDVLDVEEREKHWLINCQDVSAE